MHVKTPVSVAAKTAIVRDANWLAHRYDATHDAFQFRHVPREQHRSATFLTDEYLGQAAQIIPIARMEALAASPENAPLHFIFHSAFCASTMLVRALDVPNMAMGLSEPVLLNDMVGWRRRGAERHMLAAVIDASLTLTQRPFHRGEAVIVKPSNIFNSLIAVTMALRPASKAVFLYSPLPVFLTSVARKGLWCRLWARELLEGQLRDGFVELGFEPSDYFRQSDLQVAAVGWLAQHRLFSMLAEQLGPDRVCTLNSEILTSRLAETLTAVARHMGLNSNTDVERALLSNPALHRHSKFGQQFSSEDRAREQNEARNAYGDEIDKVVTWTLAVAKANGITLELPNALKL